MQYHVHSFLSKYWDVVSEVSIVARVMGVVSCFLTVDEKGDIRTSSDVWKCIGDDEKNVDG